MKTGYRFEWTGPYTGRLVKVNPVHKHPLHPMRMASLKTGTFRVSPRGQDIDSADGRYDAHVRMEHGEIHVDVFNSKEPNVSKAHLKSDSFSSKRDANSFLAGYGFKVRIA